MSNTQPLIPENIQKAVEILAYNENMWEGFTVHGKDVSTVRSLAESDYAWTEKQGRLALAMIKRYKTLFTKYGIDIQPLIDKPVWRDEFRKIDFEKSIRSYTDELGNHKIELKFPYNEKIIKLVRCLNHQKLRGLKFSQYDGESKSWTFDYIDVNCYFLALISIRYDFQILNPEIIDDYENIKKEKLNYKKMSAYIQDEEIKFKNADESFDEWWNKNYKNKKFIQQLDVVNKNIYCDKNFTTVTSEKSHLADVIACSTNRNIWIDRNKYSLKETLSALMELNDFPIFVPYAELETHKDLKEVENFFKAWKGLGLADSGISFTYDFKEPIDFRAKTEDTYSLESVYGTKHLGERKDIYERWLDLVSFSRTSKIISNQTKVIFINRKLSRTFLKSNLRPRVALNIEDNSFWPTGSNTVNILVDNLSKRLYYTSRKPI